MGTYLRTLDEAIDAVADILELPEQRDRIIQCTIRIMMCLDPEPREFLADSQALLIEGGLEALAAKRRDLIESLDADTAVAVLNPEEDGLFDSVGSSLDALRLSDVAFRVFPELRRGYEPWRLARALRRKESKFEEILTQGIRRRGGEGYRQAQQSLERLIREDEPAWAARSALLHDVCRNFFQSSRVSDTPVSDAEVLFALFAVDDARAFELLEALQEGPDAAQELARLTFECLVALRSIQEKAA